MDVLIFFEVSDTPSQTHGKEGRMGLFGVMFCAAGFLLLIVFMLVQVLRPLDPQGQDLILSLFAREDEWVYGVQLRDRSGGRMGWDIYTYLRAMASSQGNREPLLEGREGLIQFQSRGYRPRYYYRLTATGIARRKMLLEAKRSDGDSGGG